MKCKFSFLVLCSLLLLVGCGNNSESVERSKEVVSYINNKYGFEPEVISEDKGIFKCKDKSGVEFSVKDNADDYQREDIIKAVNGRIISSQTDIKYGDDFRVKGHFDGTNFDEVLKDTKIVIQYVNNTTKNFSMDDLYDILGKCDAIVINVPELIDASDLLSGKKSIDDYMLTVLDYNTSASGYKKYNITRFKDLVFLDNVKVEKIPNLDLINFYKTGVVNQEAVLKSFQITKKKNKAVTVLIPVDKVNADDLLAYRFADSHYTIKYRTSPLELTEDGLYYKADIGGKAKIVKFTVIRR